MTVLHNPTALSRIARLSGASVIIAEMIDAEGMSLATALGTDRFAGITVPIVAVVQPLRAETRLIAGAIREGVTDLAVVTIDDLAETVERVAVSETGLLADMRSMALRVLSEPAAYALLACVRVSRGRANAKEVASALGSSERSVARLFAEVGLPGLGLTIRWVRVLLAIDEIARGRCLAETANSHGYSTPSALRRAINELVGAEAQTLRGATARSAALAKFERVLRDAAAGLSPERPIAPTHRRLWRRLLDYRTPSQAAAMSRTRWFSPLEKRSGQRST